MVNIAETGPPTIEGDGSILEAAILDEGVTDPVSYAEFLNRAYRGEVAALDGLPLREAGIRITKHGLKVYHDDGTGMIRQALSRAPDSSWRLVTVAISPLKQAAKPVSIHETDNEFDARVMGDALRNSIFHQRLIEVAGA